MKTKKIIFLLLALLIACGTSAYAGGLIESLFGGADKGPATKGKVTVKGLGRYEGKYVMGLADSDPALVAAGNISSGGDITAGAVKGGKVTLKVWRKETDGFGSFAGNGTDTLFLSVYDEETPSSGIATGLVEVAFKKGSGSGKGIFIGSGPFAGGTFSGGKTASGRGDSGGGLLGGILGRLFGGGDKQAKAPKETDDTSSDDSSGGGLLGRLFGSSGGSDDSSSGGGGGRSGGVGGTSGWPGNALLAEYGLSGLTPPTGVTRFTHAEDEDDEGLQINWTGSSANDAHITSYFNNSNWSLFMDMATPNGGHMWNYDHPIFTSATYFREGASKCSIAVIK